MEETELLVTSENLATGQETSLNDSFQENEDSGVESAINANDKLLPDGANSSTSDIETETVVDTSNVPENKAQQENTDRKIVPPSTESIKSETQRLTREAVVSVPCHKPKNCSFSEFLSRTTVYNNCRGINKNGVISSAKLSPEKLRIFAEEIYAKEKEAKEFFIDFTDENRNDEIKEVVQAPEDSSENISIEATALGSGSKPSDEECNQVPKIEQSPALDLELKASDEGKVECNYVPKLEKYKKEDGISRMNLHQKKFESNTEIIFDFENESGKKRKIGLRGCVPKSDGIELDDFKNSSLYLKVKAMLKKTISAKRRQDILQKLSQNDHGKDLPENAESLKNEIDEEEDSVVNSKGLENNEDQEEINEDIAGNGDETDEDSNVKCSGTEEEEDDADDEEEEEDDDDNEIRVLSPKRNFKRVKLLDSSSSDSDDEEKTVFNSNDLQSVVDEEATKSKDVRLDVAPYDLVQTNESNVESQLMALCSGTFDQSFKSTNPETSSKLTDEDSSTDDEGIIARRKKCTKITFSDGENSCDENSEKLNICDNSCSSKGKDLEDKAVETYIDYDSDENEILVDMSKTDIRQEANDFFENEAELSDSEWGSADEDERGLDTYECELGDEEQFDQNKLKSDLGKIHLRRLLDQDAREVKILEQQLLATEEDAVQRQRQFKWKNDGMENNTGLNPRTTPEPELGETDEEDEVNWRQLRHERESVLKKAFNREDEQNLFTTETKTKIVTGVETGKKLLLLQPKNQTTSPTVQSSATKFLIQKAPQKSIEKGSFLAREETTLSKLTSLLKSGVDGDQGPQIKTGKGTFVFATTDIIDKTAKRKIQMLDSDFDEDHDNRAKRNLLKYDS